MSDSKVILITGCSSGFGKIAAKDLARLGHTVYATMRNVNSSNSDSAAELQGFAKSENLSLEVLEIDVRDDQSVNSAVDRIIHDQDRIDVLINNAGVMPVGVTEAYTIDQFRDNLDVNVLGPFRLMRGVLPQMKTQGKGLIINVSTVLGRVTVPFFGVYQAGKFALEALSETMRYEVSPSGVEVVIIEPGPFATDLVANSPGPADSDRLENNADLVNTLQEMMASITQDIFENPEAPIDAQILVDDMVKVINMPHGQRPVRTVSGIDFGVNEMNRVLEPLRVQALTNLGLESMDKVSG